MKMKLSHAYISRLSVNLTTVVVKLTNWLLTEGFSIRTFLPIRDDLVSRLSRGRLGLKEYKEICNFVTRRTLGADCERPACKIPRWAWFLIRKSKKSRAEKYYVLCVVQLHRLVHLPPDMDTETITRPFQGRLFRILSEMRDIRLSAELLGKRLKVTPINPLNLKWVTSFSAGPNGRPAVSYAKEDLKAILSNKTSGLRVLLFIIAFRLVNLDEVKSTISQMFKSLGDKPVADKNFYENRLAFLSDKGGKTRVVGIGNIYYQSLLRPLHDYMFSILRRNPCDGTHDQQAQVRRVIEASKSGKTLHSVDMSACTDRFPAMFQALTLYLMGSFTLFQTVCWYLLIAMNTFAIGKSGLSTTYAVGQPMGYLSSWSAMTVSHHHLVAWAAVRAKVSLPFNEYAIIGDDIVIFDTDVATEYYYILSLLGIEYNKNKSFAQSGLAEFAKGYYLEGRDFKPISPDLLLWSNLEGVGKMVGLVDVMRTKPFYVDMIPFSRLFPRLKDLTTILQFTSSENWPFDFPHWGIKGLDFALAITRVNLGIASLKRGERIHELTSSWVVHNREVYGDHNYRSPYISIGQKNSSNMPGVIFCTSHNENCGCERILLGESFIAYSPECWPAGWASIAPLVEKAVACGLSYKDLEVLTGPDRKKSEYRTSKAYKEVIKMYPILKSSGWGLLGNLKFSFLDE